MVGWNLLIYPQSSTVALMKFGNEYKLFHTSFYSGCRNLYMRRSSLTILVKHEKISEVIYAKDIDAAINAVLA